MRIPTQKIHNILTYALAFSLPLYRQIPPILIVLLLLNWLIEGNWKEKISNYKKNKIALLPCLLYILYCLGMLYTENIEFGMKDLEMKLSLLILPLLFASKSWLKKEEIDKIMYFFIVGCGLAVIICFSHSTYLYFNEIQQVKNGTLHDTYTNVNFFFSSQLSYFMHPSYFAMYLCFGIIFLLILLTNHNLTRYKLVLLVIASTILTLFIFFLSSKMGIICVLIIWVTFFIYLMLKLKWYLQGISLLLMLGVASYIIVKSSKILTFKFTDAVSAVSAPSGNTSLESSAVRVTIWKISKELILEMPFIGYGTGDIHNELDRKYLEQKLNLEFEKKLNTHNQFFQTGIAIGWPGILLLIFLFVLLAFLTLKDKNYLFLFFLLLFLLNIMVESMLEIQVGIIFFSFFYSITFSRTKDEQSIVS